MYLTTYRCAIKRVISFLAAAIVVLSCGPQTDTSELSIRNGIHLEKSDQNTAPGVVFIGMCSATIVSTNTLITAAHCVNEGQEVCIRSAALTGTCSKKTYLPSNYHTGRYQRLPDGQTMEITNFSVDVAVVVFEGNPFLNYFSVGSTKPRQRDRVIMVGYSEFQNNEPGRGSKRWGTNYISSFNRGELDSIQTYDGNSVDRVAVDKGDSGGTMLNNKCELVGVTSRNCGDKGNCSIHTNITNDTNRKWLLNQITSRGAQICGLPGTNDQFCPSSGRAAVASNPAKESDGTAAFPCSPGSGGSNRSADDGKIKIGLTGLVQNAFKMHVSIPSGLSVAACANVNSAEECQPTLSGKYFAGQSLRTAGTRSIFEIQKNLSQADLQTTWTLVGRDASGQIKQTRKFKISQ